MVASATSTLSVPMKKRITFGRHDDPHARIYDHWVRHPAWASMGLHAKVLLTETMASYRPSRLNLFPMSNARAARQLKCAENTAAKAIAELVERGWFVLERRGAMTGQRGARERMVSLGMFKTETRVDNRDAALDWAPSGGDADSGTPQKRGANGSKCGSESTDADRPGNVRDALARKAG